MAYGDAQVSIPVTWSVYYPGWVDCGLKGDSLYLGPATPSAIGCGAESANSRAMTMVLERCKTFYAKKEAEKYEREQRTALDKGTWIDPREATEKFGEYADRWLTERHDLRPRTLELYRSLLRLHVKPRSGGLQLGKVASSSPLVRTWNAELARDHPSTAAKAYRLLHEICSIGVADGVIGRNPCTVKGAGQEHSPERPTATEAEVSALANAMPPDLRLTVVFAAYCQLRRGESLGLERRDFDLLHGEVRSPAALTECVAASVSPP